MNRIKQILIVDDDPNYIDLVERALLTCQSVWSLKSLFDGSKILEWLESNDRPNLIFLDINLPGASGFDILRTLKTVKKYKDIPVLILSVSDREQDIIRSYKIGANGYIEKPQVFAELVACMKLINLNQFNFGGTLSEDWTQGDNLN